MPGITIYLSSEDLQRSPERDWLYKNDGVKIDLNVLVMDKIYRCSSQNDVEDKPVLSLIRDDLFLH